MNIVRRDLRWQPSIAVGFLGLAAASAVFLAGVLADRPSLGDVPPLWDRGTRWLSNASTLPATVPSCPDPGGSWWFQGTLLCTTAPGEP